jgi:hypothetical protein
MILSIETVLALLLLSGSTLCESNGFKKVILDTHNKYRDRHDAYPLKWDSELADHAQGWADRCQFRHSTVSTAYFAYECLFVTAFNQVSIIIDIIGS